MTTEFVSHIETLKPARELRFRPTPGFGKFKKFFPRESVAHPAKMNLYLTQYLIKKYTNEGDTVLDPMGGTGSTVVFASLNNRNGIAVELEEKFHTWEKESKKRVDDLPTLFKGEITLIRGDARNLSALLSHVSPSEVITSPPYSGSNIHDYGETNKALLAFEKNIRESFMTTGCFEHEGKKWTEKEWREVNSGELKPRGMPELWAKIMQNKFNMHYNDQNPQNIANLDHGKVDSIVFSPPYNTRTDGAGMNKTGIPDARGINEGRAETLKYSDDPNNIGQIRTHGQVNTVISSPPYANSANGHNHDELFERLTKDESSGRYNRKSHPHTAEQYSDNPENIGNLPPGKIDSVVTSVPYADSMSRAGRGGPDKHPEKRVNQHPNAWLPEAEYSADPSNIGNLPNGKVDSIVTSPPYEQSEAFQDTDFVTKVGYDQTEVYRTAKLKGEAHLIAGHARSGEAEQAYMERVKNGRIENPDSIGKLKKETYLQAMFQVYSEIWKVLKPGGLAVIVIKPFQRARVVTDLPWQTFQLLQKIGFVLEDVAKLRLEHLSFWRILLYKKYPEMERIVHEYIIVVRKPVIVRK